jgi:hypothetical protein
MDDNIVSLLNRVADHEKRMKKLEREITDLKDAVINLQHRDRQPPQTPK